MAPEQEDPVEAGPVELAQAKGPLAVIEAEGGTTVADIMGAIMAVTTVTGITITGEMLAVTGTDTARSII